MSYYCHDCGKVIEEDTDTLCADCFRELGPVPFTQFGKTKMVPRDIRDRSGDKIRVEKFDSTLWVERGEDWYGLMGSRSNRVLVVERENWLKAPEVN